MANYTTSMHETAAEDAMVAGPKHQHATENLHSVGTQHTKYDENVSELRDPIAAVFSLPELLATALSYLPIKDLARALAISRHWQRVILDSKQLRRNLFLEPTHTREYLNLVKSYDRPGFLTRTIARTRVWHSKEIVVVHPALTEECDPTICDRIFIELPMLDKLAVIPPDTLLFQPPLETVDIGDGERTYPLGSTEGATFGELVKGCQWIRTELQQGLSTDDVCIPRASRGNRVLSLHADKVVASDSSQVDGIRAKMADRQACTVKPCSGEHLSEFGEICVIDGKICWID